MLLSYLKAGVSVTAVCMLCASASAYSMFNTYTVSFVSDGEPSKIMTVETFDTQGGTRDLQAVEVELFHSGHFEAKVWNDDPIKSAEVKARLIRQWLLSGPDIDPAATETYKLYTSPQVHLDPGQEHDFGQVGYSKTAAGTYNPVDVTLYETSGPGTVDFTVTPLLMVNDLAFIGGAPDVWRMQVKNPDLTVEAKVTYIYIPEPATLAMLLVAAPFLRYRATKR